MADQTIQPGSVTRLFTHGYGQIDPFTGESLNDRYTLVTAADGSSARLAMVATFGRNWCEEYDGPADPRIASYLPRMTLRAHLNFAPEQPMPPGFEYVRDAADPTGLAYTRADDGEQPQPVAGREPMHTGAMTASGLIEVDNSEPAPESVTVYFSFGHGQTDPDTGQDLLGHYVTIVGPSYAACRDAMFASRYGREWSFEYLAGTPTADEWIPRWTEHERIVLETPRVVADVLPPGASCNGAPEGFEADCGMPGAHGPH